MRPGIARRRIGEHRSAGLAADAMQRFDLRADVGQKRDLAKERPDLVRTLHERLKARRQAVAAPMAARRSAAYQPR
jgi:hypothetical protein